MSILLIVFDLVSLVVGMAMDLPVVWWLWLAALILLVVLVIVMFVLARVAGKIEGTKITAADMAVLSVVCLIGGVAVVLLRAIGLGTIVAGIVGAVVSIIAFFLGMMATSMNKEVLD